MSSLSDNTEGPRYEGTFDSERPHLGVVTDYQGGRFARFPSLEHARRAAAHFNRQPDNDPPMSWRSIATGELIDSQPTPEEP